MQKTADEKGDGLNLARTQKKTLKIGLILLAYATFIGLGMRDGLLGVAWPSLRADFLQPLDAIGILLLAGVSGYMTSSFLIGSLIARLGIGNLLVIGSGLAGIASFGMIFAPFWWMLILFSVIGGLGGGIMDAGLNTYVAAHYGEAPMQWLHASYGMGITCGPLIMTFALAQMGSWRPGYGVAGGFQVLLVACLLLTLPMWKAKSASSEVDEPKRLTDYKTPMGETLRQPLVWLSSLLFFLYVGAEMSMGTWTYSLLIESRGIDPALAGFLTGSYWGMFTIGRIVAGLFSQRVRVERLIEVCLTGSLLSAALYAWNPFRLSSVLAVALIGFFIAPIFPAFISGTSKRVGARFAANTIGIQMAATGLATAVVPGVLGVLARYFSLETIPLCLVIVFLLLIGSYLFTQKNHPNQEYSS